MGRLLRAAHRGRTVLVCLALGTGGCVLETPSELDTPAPLSAPRTGRSRAEQLTEQLLQLRELERGGGADRRDELRGRMAEVARTRREELETLASTDPAEVLRLAMPAEVRARMPAEVRPLVEGAVDVTGTIELTCADHATSAAPAPFLGETQTVCEATLHLGGGARRTLDFARGRPLLDSGTHVRVRGVEVGGHIVAHDAGDPATVTTLEAFAGLPTTGEQRIMVVLYNFSDDASEPITPQHLSDQLFVRTDAWFREVSHGQTWLTGDVYGWFTVPYTRAEWNGPIDRIAILDGLAAGAGANVASYPRRVYYNTSGPGSGGGGYAGWGTVGGNPSLVGITGNPRVGLLAHELGHNLTLWHSNALDCEAGVVIAADCTHVEYGDYWDVMGNSWEAPHFNAFQKERIGWLGTEASAPILTVAESGTYELAVFEDLAAEGPKALRILRANDPATGANDWYYVELRQAIGMDAAIANDPLGQSLLEGVLIHTGNDRNDNSSYQLDMTPTRFSPYIGDADFGDSALVVGASYTDAQAGVTLTTIAAGPSGGSVRVDFATDPCVRADPAVTLAPATLFGPAGTTLAWTVTITNQDSPACGASTFVLDATAPAGWPAALDAGSLTILPLASATTTLRVTSAADAVAGAHPVLVAATEGDRGGEASATYEVSRPPECIRSAPAIALAPSRQSALAGATLGWTVTLTNRDSPACTAATFDLSATAPAGWSVTLGRPDLAASPGATASTTLSVISAAGAAPGDHAIGAAATSRASGLGASASATYEVTPPPPCARATPAVTVSPGTVWVEAGQAASLEVRVENRDSASCAEATFALAALVPAGFTVDLEGAVTLAAGSATTLPLDLQPDPAAPGFHAVTVEVTHGADPARVARASATVVVTATLEVVVRTSGPSYAGGDTVPVDVDVAALGLPVAGATIVLTVRPPRGRGMVVSLVTDAAGRAHHDLHLSTRAKAGTWTLVADATSGPSAGTATVTFTVARRR